MPDTTFFLGRRLENNGDAGPDLHYDPADLTTHAVIIGMTGSGKTGLLIGLLEEAARQGLPAIIIDPKGDLTNLLLHFTELQGTDFAPWIDPEAARRKGVTVEQLAADTATRWREGLQGWGLGSEQIKALSEAVDYAIYTPGSTAATPVSLLSSFEAPALAWDENREVLRERISATITALLGLVGLNDIDPLRSREHILLSNLLESAWSKGQSLDLTTLIEQVQTPPIQKLGAFPLERFFPEKDRFDLALLLNNFLASPSFQTWMEGVPLEASSFLYGSDQKPRFSIFYLAHLPEAERMFFVTLLLAAVETWMRGQRGTSELRALLAFDEITGYLPPIANPPSRPVLLRLLKQARAFGLGLALATQNPTDLNYKALSNAGTWFIGRLQTERDKERLLDGLQALEGGIDRAAFDRLMAAVKPRTFVLHNIHGAGPGLFTTRWTMNYLAGPLTRAQLPALVMPASAVREDDGNISFAPPVTPPPKRMNAETGLSIGVGDGVHPPSARIYDESARPITPPPKRVIAEAEPVAAPASALDGYAQDKPGVHDTVEEYLLGASLSLQKALAGGAFAGPLEAVGMVYRPALLAQAEARYMARKYNLTYTKTFTALALTARPNWESGGLPPLSPDEAAALRQAAPLPNTRFAALPDEWNSAKAIAALQKDWLDWVYRSSTIQVWANEALKVYGGPDVSEGLFRRLVDDAMRAQMQPDLDKTAATFNNRLLALKRRIEKQQDTIEQRTDEVDQRRAEQTGADFELITSFFTRRRRSITTSLTKRRLTSQARAELEEARNNLEGLEQEWQHLQQERQAAMQRVSQDWQQKAVQVSQVPVAPYRKDIYSILFGIAWVPFYLVKARDGLIEAPAVPFKV